MICSGERKKLLEEGNEDSLHVKIIVHVRNVNNYECRPTTDQELAERCYIGAGQTLRVHSTGGSTFPPELTSWPPS